MKNEEILEKLGLTDKEGKIYLALLELGPALISQIARHTGLHRPNIYQALPELQTRGLVMNSIKGKQKLYIAESPEKLKLLAENLKMRLENFLPELEKIYASQNKKPVIKVITGPNGPTFVLNDLVQTLKRGETFYRYSSRNNTNQYEKYIPKDFRERRDAKNLQRFVITSENRMKEKKPRLDRAIKVVPSKYGLFDYNVVQLIYGDKVAFTDYNTETVVIIENPIIAEFQKKIFKVLFDLL